MGCECRDLAITPRKSHHLTMSGVPPTPDLRARMSEFRLISSGLHSGPDVAGATGIRRVLNIPLEFGREKLE